MFKKDTPFDLADIRFVKRITVGNSDPARLKDEAYIQGQQALLNRCLNEMPRGHIIGQEKNFNVIRIGEHQVVLQSIVYHIGFRRKPVWIEEE